MVNRGLELECEGMHCAGVGARRFRGSLVMR